MHTESQSHSALAVLAVIDERYGPTCHSHTVITYRVVLYCIVFVLCGRLYIFNLTLPF